MLGIKSFAESPMSTRGIPRETRAEFICTATFVADGNRLKYAYPVEMVASGIFDVDSANRIQHVQTDLLGQALFDAFPTTAVLFSAYINCDAILNAEGDIVGDGWTRVVPDTEEWTNNLLW